jgi:DNA-directed RNA polymerase beta subunit
MAQRLYFAGNTHSKSDDVVGGVKTYVAIVKGENVPSRVFPLSF